MGHGFLLKISPLNEFNIIIFITTQIYLSTLIAFVFIYFVFKHEAISSQDGLTFNILKL